MKLKIRSQPSMLITFSGIDGSGKTSRAKLLFNSCQQCGLRVKYVWSRGGSSRFAGFFIKLGKGIFHLSRTHEIEHKIEVKKVNQRKGYLKNKWIRFLWYLLVLIELTTSYNLKVRGLLLLGWVVICDRYILDTLVELNAYSEEQKFIERLFKRLFILLNPKPDLSYLINVPTRIAMQRTEGEDNEHLQRQALIYNQFSKEFKVIVVEGIQDYPNMDDTITYETLTMYYQKFNTFARKIFLSNPDQLNPKSEDK